MMLRTRGAEREDETAPARDVVVLRRIATACTTGIARTAICARKRMRQLYIRKTPECLRRAMRGDTPHAISGRACTLVSRIGLPSSAQSDVAASLACQGGVRCSCTAHTRKPDGAL